MFLTGPLGPENHKYEDTSVYRKMHFVIYERSIDENIRTEFMAFTISRIMVNNGPQTHLDPHQMFRTRIFLNYMALYYTEI